MESSAVAYKATVDVVKSGRFNTCNVNTTGSEKDVNIFTTVYDFKHAVFTTTGLIGKINKRFVKNDHEGEVVILTDCRVGYAVDT